MRFALITLLFIVATNTANATDAPSSQDRIALADTLDRKCQAVQYAQTMKDAAASGQVIAPELLDAQTIPLDKIRARMKADPDTERHDRRIVTACNCIMSKWKQRVLASRTVANFHAISVDMIEDGKTQASTAHYNACMAKAREVR